MIDFTDTELDVITAAVLAAAAALTETASEPVSEQDRALEHLSVTSIASIMLKLARSSDARMTVISASFDMLNARASELSKARSNG